MRVDVTEPTVSFVVTASNGGRALDTDGEKTSTFLRTRGCQVAVNASPFGPIPRREGEPTDILGLVVSAREPYSPPEGTRGALLIGRDNRPRIAQPPFDLADVADAVGGFDLLLEDGRNVGARDDLHPRTAAGVSHDGRTLYLLVIDGRQQGVSEGATTAEAAEWLQRLGAWDGLNLDGGGSTALVVSDGHGGARLLNRPIDGQVPGRERVNGNSLGIFARPLP